MSDMIVAQTPPARSVIDETRQRELAIVNSRRYGIITQADHDAQLKSLRDPTQTATLSDVPVRAKGRKMVRDFRGQWFPAAGPFESERAAREAIPTIDHGGNGGQWASNQTGKHGWCAAPPRTWVGCCMDNNASL